MPGCRINTAIVCLALALAASYADVSPTSDWHAVAGMQKPEATA